MVLRQKLVDGSLQVAEELLPQVKDRYLRGVTLTKLLDLLRQKAVYCI